MQTNDAYTVVAYVGVPSEEHNDDNGGIAGHDDDATFVDARLASRNGLSRGINNPHSGQNTPCEIK